MRQRLLRLMAVAVVMGIVCLLVIVSSAQESPAAATGASPAASPVASPAASPVASLAPVGRSVSVTGLVTIEIRDSGFDPAYVEATNGHDLTITLINSGTRRHSFRIDHFQVNVSLAPGERTTVVIAAPDLGDFSYYSDAPGDAGMTGHLTFYI